jgi:hypothetical protein
MQKDKQMSAQPIATTPTYIALFLSDYNTYEISELTGAAEATVKMKVSRERDLHPQIPPRFKRTTNPPKTTEKRRYAGFNGKTKDVPDIAHLLTAEGKALFLSIYPEWTGRI